jgi:hypothetical protein
MRSICKEIYKQYVYIRHYIKLNIETIYNKNVPQSPYSLVNLICGV